jgi:hypothetical protein
LGSANSGDSDSGSSTSGDAGTNSSALSSSGDDAGSDSGERRRRRNAMPVRQDGTPDPTTLSPDDYRDIPLS